MRRWAPWLLVGLLLTVLGVAVVYSRLQANRPEVVLAQALSRSLQADSVGWRLDYRPDNQGRWQLSGTLAGGGRFESAGSYARGTDQVGLGLVSPDGQDAYLRLQNSAALVQLLGDEAADYGIEAGRNPLATLDGRWLRIPAGLKQTVLSGGGTQTTDFDGAARDRLAEIFRRHRFIYVDRQLPEAELDGVAAYHYRLGIDNRRLDQFIAAAQREVPQLPLTDQRVSQLKEVLQQADRLEIWIERSNRQILQLQYTAIGDGLDRHIRLKLSDYGKKVQLQPPVGAVPLFDALQTINRNQSLSGSNQ